jgi:hypothetical protein
MDAPRAESFQCGKSVPRSLEAGHDLPISHLLTDHLSGTPSAGVSPPAPSHLHMEAER